MSTTGRPMHVILMITDGHGHYTGDLDWGTAEGLNLKKRFERLDLVGNGFIQFSKVVSPAVSTIMSIESIVSGTFAARAHKLHWREWPAWDKFKHETLTDLFREAGYDVNGFSYLLNSDNWIPSLCIYRPELYNEFPSEKRDTHSHEAVFFALKDFFAHAFRPDVPNFLILHSSFLHDLWDDIWKLFAVNGITADNSVAVLTADHYFPRNFGRLWLLGERDGYQLFHHTDLTEYNTHVLLYLRYPGSTGHTYDEVVSGYDIAPTIAELSGVAPRWSAPLDAVSLCPVLRGETLPSRLLRSDNLYPFQVGEKQGRVTAIRNGRFKYVYRPDPVSSYIAYRMSEGWATVLTREEFYDLDTDSAEQCNLVGSSDPETVQALTACREFYLQSTQDIIKEHAIGLARYLRAEVPRSLLHAVDKGKLLCIQSSPREIFAAIVWMLRELRPSWEIIVLARPSAVPLLPATVTISLLSEDELLVEQKLRAAIEAIAGSGFDAAVNTSSVPLGTYASLYDPDCHHWSDLEVSSAVLLSLDRTQTFTVALDGSVRQMSGVIILLQKLIFPIYARVRSLAEIIVRIAGAVRRGNTATTIKRSFSARIVRSSR